MLIEEKIHFLETGCIELLRSLDAHAKGNWGVMNGQQMVEHMSEMIRMAGGKDIYAVVTPEEHLPKYKAFLLSDKEFRPNTKNPIMPEEPVMVRLSGMQEAVDEFKKEMSDFFEVFEKEPSKITTHHVFGELNYEENVILLYKHATHHLRQFGLM